MNNLKILDISDLDWNDHRRVNKLVNELSESCETSGFFYLKVSDEFGQTCIEMLQSAKEVFRIPEDEKVKLINDGTSQMFHKGKCNFIKLVIKKIFRFLIFYYIKY